MAAAVRLAIAMTMLPAFATPLVGQWLHHPQATGNAHVDNKMAPFACYFYSTWTSGDFVPTLWSHFNNLGPLTTNPAKGYHNSLN